MKKTLVRLPKPQSAIKAIPFRTRLGGSLVLVALVAGIGLMAARPGHTAGGPIAVNVANTPLYAVTQDSDNAARQPVSVTVLLGSSTITGLVSSNALYTVPAGKRLVIDYVSSTAYNAGDANSYNFYVTTTQNSQGQHINFNELPDTSPYSAASQKVELYADEGTSVSVTVFNNKKNAPDVQFTMAGHLVNLP